jgi:asparagine synthase (glutamine-hydrolysing)
MCGIIGGNWFGNQEDVESSLRRIDHRGRDATRVEEVAQGFWLGHNRLAIQDLSSGATQPFHSGDCILTFNGELWRRTLDSYSFLWDKYGMMTQRSDTELLLLMYREYGGDLQDFMSRLDGMFAFGIVDKGRNRLILGRDYMGRLPLHYLVEHGDGSILSALKPGRVCFASELKSFPREIRGRASLMPPGTALTYDLETGEVDSVRFHDFDSYKVREGAEVPCDLEDRGLDYYVQGFRSRLAEAVCNESIADVPVCTILSGGIDSTVITYLLSKMVPNLKAFVVHVDHGGRRGNVRDDLYWAQVAAKSIGVDLIEVHVTKQQILDRLGDAVYAAEDFKWVQVSPTVAQLFLSQAIQEAGYKVVFGGEGADEMFASYRDVQRWSWKDPVTWHNKRVRLCQKLHETNIIRSNKAMMYGGTVELRTPFLDREVVDFALRIPTRYRDTIVGKTTVVKYVLRESFRGDLPEDLVLRPKVPFQDGAHSDFLKDLLPTMKDIYEGHFG